MYFSIGVKKNLIKSDKASKTQITLQKGNLKWPSTNYINFLKCSDTFFMETSLR